jgi:hypothetical protein
MTLHFASSLWAWVASCSGFRFTHNYRHTTTAVGLLHTRDQPSQRQLPTQHATNATEKQAMTSAGFEPAIPAIKRMQTYAVYRRAIGIGRLTLRSKLLYSGLNTEGWEMARITSSAGKACGCSCCVCEMLQEWGNVSRWRVRLSGEVRQLRTTRPSVAIREKQNKYTGKCQAMWYRKRFWRNAWS